MNKMKYFLMVCLMGMASVSYAQFTNSQKSSTGGSSDAEAWQGFRVSFHPISFSPDKGDSMSATAFSFGYVKSFGVSQNIPLFVEAGANVMWTTKDFADDFVDYLEDYDEYLDDWKVKLNMFSVNIPVNFGYKYQINDNIALFPYVGVNFRVNAFGKVKEEWGDDSESYDVFKKDDMRDLELLGGDAWKRFQFGWQIGVALHANKFSVSASYGKDFSEIAKKVKVAMPSITVGWNF